MKAKTIKSVLRRKVDHWCSTIADENVRKLVEENTIVTGGAIVSMMLGEPVNDYDVYFRSPEALFAVTKYYVDNFKTNPPTTFKDGNEAVPIYLAGKDKKTVESFEQWRSPEENGERLRIVVKSAGVASCEGSDDYEYFEAADPERGAEYAEAVFDSKSKEEKKDSKKKELYRPIFLTANAITLSDQVQLVVRFFGDPEEIHKNYDFVHCTNYWCSWSGHLQLQPEALECMLNKELRYVGSRYPLCSIFRMRKFIERGWTVNAGQILKACMQVAELDLNDIDVLEDQLTGVDAAYFTEIIRLCQEKAAATQSNRIDSAYLVELIDRIF